MNSMKRLNNAIVVSLATIFFSGAAFAQAVNKITASEASDNIGKTATVCGIVASANYAVGSRGKPTFLNLDKPYPDHIFTAVIFDDLRPSFDYPPESLLGESICVTGNVQEHKGKPQIKLVDPNQIIRY